MSDERRVLRAIEGRCGDLPGLNVEPIRLDTTIRGEPDEPLRDEDPPRGGLAAMRLGAR